MIKKALLIIAVLFISINSNFLSNNQERSFYFDYRNQTQNILMKVGEVIYIHGDCNQSNGFDFYLKRDFKPSELVSIVKQDSFVYKGNNLYCRYIVTAKEAGKISLNFILQNEGLSFTDMFANIVIQ